MKIFFPLFFFLLLIIPSRSSSQQPDSLQLKLGQMIMIGMPGKSVDTSSSFYQEIKAGKIGGLTIYESHLTPMNTAQNLAAMLFAYQAAAPIPMFTAITQEGGIVNRLKMKYGFPLMPSAAYLGKINDIDSTKFYSDNVAYTLSRLGINVNFAPVVDIYMPQNPVLGSRERTFSADTAIITRHARQVIRSHNYFKVHTVLKHFPGHGSSTEDSHLGITDVSMTWSTDELAPFKALIREGLATAVMTAHIVNNQLDESNLPATLSAPVLTGLLRKELKFEGVVFSDDMQMKAISDEYGLKEAISMAINAGVDVLLFSGNINGKEPVSATLIMNTMLQLLQEKKINLQQINASYKRIMQMKNSR